MSLTWAQVLSWRMRRHYLTTPGTDLVDIVARLCGVQAQVASAAEMAIGVRQADPAPGGVERAIGEARLVKTWAMRGTLHALSPAHAGALLSLVAAGKSWEKPSWQRAFGVDLKQMAEMMLATPEVLAGRVLTRDEFVRELTMATGHAGLEDELRSGWGAVLKPLAWRGLLCNGPSNGNRVTFTSPATWIPDWTGLPDPAEAATIAIPAYLRAYGPTTPETFDRWLTRGVSKRSALRSWFADLGDRVTTVEVEGERSVLLAEDADELAATEPSEAVRLLPGFDQWVLGPGTQDVRIIDARRRALISKTAGWISPVVISAGRVAGVWEVSGETAQISLFPEAGPVEVKELHAEVDRIAGLLGRRLTAAIGAV